MSKRRHTPEQIIAPLRDAEVDLANGKTVRMVIRDLTGSASRHTTGGGRTSGRERWARRVNSRSCRKRTHD